MTLRYFNDISCYDQAPTSVIAAAQTLDQGKRLRVLVYVVSPSQRQDILFPNLY